MPEISIESNGRLDNTAIYYNGEQVSGVKEILLNIDENGSFDAIMSYTGEDGRVYSKNVLVDFLDKLQTREAAFTEEEAASMRNLLIASDGTLETTTVVLDGMEQFGVVSLFVNIKAPPETIFKAEITYREENGGLTTEGVF